MILDKEVYKNDKRCTALSCSVCVLCASCPLHSVFVEACQRCMSAKGAEKVSEKIYIKSIPEA
jgi:hypothetical protein